MQFKPYLRLFLNKVPEVGYRIYYKKRERIQSTNNFYELNVIVLQNYSSLNANFSVLALCHH